MNASTSAFEKCPEEHVKDRAILITMRNTAATAERPKVYRPPKTGTAGSTMKM